MVATLIEKAKSQVPDIEVEEIDVTAHPAVAVTVKVPNGTQIKKGDGHVFLPGLKGSQVAIAYVTDQGARVARSIKWEGRWDLTLRVARESKRFELPLTEHVGR